jgi:hypothetical protein
MTMSSPLIPSFYWTPISSHPFFLLDAHLHSSCLPIGRSSPLIPYSYWTPASMTSYSRPVITLKARGRVDYSQLWLRLACESSDTDIESISITDRRGLVPDAPQQDILTQPIIFSSLQKLTDMPSLDKRALLCHSEAHFQPFSSFSMYQFCLRDNNSLYFD